jgi:hypothetical protein
MFPTYFRTKKKLNIKFNQNPCTGNRVVPCGRTYGRTDIRSLIENFRNFANAPEKPETSTPLVHHYFSFRKKIYRQSQWSSCLVQGPAVARCLELQVRIPPGMDVLQLECCALSDRGFCHRPVTRPDEPYLVFVSLLSMI